MVFDYDTEDKERLYQEIIDEVQRELPGYKLIVNMDFDIAD